MEAVRSASSEPARGPWPRYDAAALGFRNYWYPVLLSRQVRRKPRAITLCGEKIVLVRDQGRVYALHDRCPHRGVPLSCGRREFPGLLTCAYHGWTYDLATGRLEVVLTDGPDSPICGKANVRTYPVEERAGVVWVYVGKQPPPPVEEDIPAELLQPNLTSEGFTEVR
ncbi:MAG TPA: Rieske 2Fe-2S domain-containing protein, partial [Chloroflexota bacterium]|nr:Rieske 2Fe-2S domain-containing protein [Chloroflexota bacterium]